MTLVILGSSQCPLCGKVLEQGQVITGLPATGHTTHPLYPYFDMGFHLDCFNNWDKKEEVRNIIKADWEEYKNSAYFKTMLDKYGYPKWLDEEPF